MKNKFGLILVFILLVSISSVNAQAPFQGGLNFAIGLPQGEFKENVEAVGLGLSGDFCYNFANSPLAIGLSFGFLNYGSETREEPWSQTIPDVFVDVTTTNNIFMGHALMRVQPPRGAFLPYLEGLVGFSYLTTDTRVEDQGGLNEDDIASSNNFNDITFSYGAGGGFMIQVYKPDRTRSIQSSLAGVYIDLRVRYLKGGIAEYLKEGSIDIDEDSNVNYDVDESFTDLITIHIGVTAAFM